MTRQYIDCRDFPSESNCTVAISADGEQELIEAAVQHAVTVHRHTDTPEFRQQLRRMFREETPPGRGDMPAGTRPGAGEAPRPHS